tara:strand:- start:481 stop:657 length:177 start_codon:yes stop_codon:yes gene_type:complete
MSEKRNITIPIGEYDIELFQRLVIDQNVNGEDNTFTWTFETDDGEPINLNFIKDEEEE